MSMIDALELGSNLWGSLAVFMAFAMSVFLCSAFSMQICMAYFGEDIPTFPGAMAATFKVLISVGAILLVGYGFLGPMYILAAPPAVIAALSIISKVAQCERFAAATIAVSHATMTGAAVFLCGFVFWIGLTTVGVDMESKAEQVVAIATESSQERLPYHQRRRGRKTKTRSVSHSNPFVETSPGASSGPDQEH